MALKAQLDNDLKTALLGGDRFRGDLLRNIKAAILNEEVAKQKRDEGLSDAEVETVLTREAKKRNESAELYRQNDRVELAETEERELEIIQEFLPEQMSEADVQTVVDAKIAELGASDMSAMGQVIGAVKQQVGSAADGALVAKLVKETLQK